MSKRLKFLLFNILGLQITWIACAYGASHSQPHIGVVVGLMYLILHFTFTTSRHIDILTMCILATIGITLDYFNLRVGIISFHQSDSNFNFIPIWLIVLWCVFALVIPHSLYWLSKKPILAFILGGTGGSSSYWLGHKLNAIILSEPLTASITVYFVQWAFYMLIAYSLYRSIRNYSIYCSST